MEAEYKEIQGKGLALDMSRGKPAKVQLDLSEKMLTIISKNEEAVAEMVWIAVITADRLVFRKPED